MPSKPAQSLPRIMMEKTGIFDTIEAFVEGKLAPEEQIAFKKKCLSSPELSAAVEEYRMLRKGIEESGRKELRAKLAAWDKTIVQKEKTAFTFFKIAATVFCLAVIGMSLALILDNRQPRGSDIAQSYFDPYPNIVGERNGDESSGVYSILQLYDRGEYEEVIYRFEKYDDAIGNNNASLMRFYLGESLLAVGEYQHAAEILESFNHRENALYEVARFHLALALILSGDDEKARQTLDIINTEKGPYREKAGELLKYFDDQPGTDEANMPKE